MNDIEAIHAIEVMLAEEEICGCFDFAPIELAALSHAIASLKARSDAEVVCEYIKENSMSNLHWNLFMDKWVISHTDFAAPTLADLAKKIGEVK